VCSSDLHIIFQTFSVFNSVEKICEKFVENVYPMYKDECKFNNKVEEMMINFNGAGSIVKRNRTVELKSLAVNNSLHLMDRYKKDPDGTLRYCKEIIDRYMIVDECKQLTDSDSLSYDVDDYDINKKRTKRVLGRTKVDEVSYFE
jgi:hypothetical protein